MEECKHCGEVLEDSDYETGVCGCCGEDLDSSPCPPIFQSVINNVLADEEE